MPMSIHPIDSTGQAISAEADCWAFVLVLNGTIAQPARLASASSPFIACLRKGEVLEANCAGSRESAIAVIFRPQIVNQELPRALSLSPETIEDQFLRRDVELVQPFARDLGACVNLLPGEADFLSMLLRNAFSICSLQDDPYWPCRSRSCFLEVLFFLHSKDHQIPARVNTNASKVLEFIHSHYQEKMSLDELARRFGTNRTSLQRQFKAEYNKNVFEYVSQYRIQMARVLIRNTELSLKEIGYRVGFKDYSHFFREFSRQCGIAPAEFKKGPARVQVYESEGRRSRVIGKGGGGNA